MTFFFSEIWRRVFSLGLSDGGPAAKFQKNNFQKKNKKILVFARIFSNCKYCLLLFVIFYTLQVNFWCHLQCFFPLHVHFLCYLQCFLFLKTLFAAIYNVFQSSSQFWVLLKMFLLLNAICGAIYHVFPVFK